MSAGPSTSRSGRPQRVNTAQAGGTTPTVETSTPSAMGLGTGGMSMPGAPSMTSVGPTNPADCEALAAQLLDSTIQTKRRIDIASDLRDSADNNRDVAFFEKYLAIFVPALLQLLGDEKAITFHKDSIDQRFRNTLLTFLHRLPHTEPSRQYASAITGLMVRLLKVENEENAMICIKIMIDGFRNHKDELEEHVQPFLDCVKAMYTNIKPVVEKEFGSSTNPKPISKPAGAPPTPSSEPQSTTESQDPVKPKQALLAHALYSPKVLTECPIAVVLIFQTYKPYLTSALPEFYPLVMDSIRIQPEPQRLAHLEAKERGEPTYVGVAPGITNRDMYLELMKSQVKTMAFLAYVLRGNNGNVKDYLEVFPEACVRLLRDCPPEDVGTRKELLVATRHILTVDSRSSFIPYIDILLEERCLVGTGISSREALRPLAYSVVADLIHHVRNELPLSQLAKVVFIFSRNLNDATFTSSIQTMCAKLLNTIIESIYNKGDNAESTRIMRCMFLSSLEKLEAMTEAYDRIKVFTERENRKGKEKEQDKENDKAPVADEAVVIKDPEEGKADGDGDAVMKGEGDDFADRLEYGWREIEKAMPVHAVSYAPDTLDSFCKEARYLFKTLLHTFRTLLTHTRQGDNPPPQPDSEQLARLFEYSLRCLVIYDGNRDAREIKDVIELVSQILLLFDPHAFSEVWTTKMDFFMEQSLTSANVFSVLQMLITHESVSHQLVGIVLKRLMKSLPDLGPQTKQQSALTLRLFKMSFLAINSFIQKNEAILVPHLPKLIMDCLSFAARSSDPAIYYQILRALFRSIGGGRFEALYKEVLPILQEMLDSLQYLLQHATDPLQRDIFVELTLTVPVRLTNLLPHLGYLMKPLVHALRGGPDLVSQGLRTLELCIDNLTSEFLDPTMGPVLRELMSAIHQLLKPVPANRAHATTAIKILGKLGGRNRRFHEVDNIMDYKLSLKETLAPVGFDGKSHKFDMSSAIELAGLGVDDENIVNQEDGLQMLMLSAMTLAQDDAPHPETNPAFNTTMHGLYMACQHPATSEKALDFLRSFCRRAFAHELNRQEPDSKYTSEVARKRFLPLTAGLADCFVQTLADARHDQRPALGDLLATIVSDFDAVAHSPEFSGKIDPAKSIDRMIHTFTGRFFALCYEEDWSRKMAGVCALNVFLFKVGLSRRIIVDIQLEFVRALFFILRDARKDPPKSVDEIVELVRHMIKLGQSQDDGKSKLTRLIEVLTGELLSQSALCRTTSQGCIEMLAEINGVAISDLIGPVVKARIIDPQSSPIFTKPLRVLPFPLQVGHIDAMTYILDLRPYLQDISEEFIRFLHEVLALADVDDVNMVGKPSTHKQDFWLKTLKISCLRLLRATMDGAEFAERPNLQPVRSKIISVFFKHVYSPARDVVDVAHFGLRSVLESTVKLPKDVLQAGLRPILVNLADAKRLSVSGLEGLARFLELLTNYFKVEIGTKLLDHFSSLSENGALQKSAASPLEDNMDIARMTRLVNIFRLLPPTAVHYLKPLTLKVVDVEAALHQSAPGPFTENMGMYFDKYNPEATQNLFDNIRNPRFIWTYCNVIQSGHAPLFIEELSSRIDSLCELCFKDVEAIEFVMPGLLIVRELSRTSPSWLHEHVVVVEAIVSVWRHIVDKSRKTEEDMSAIHYQQIPNLILEMLMTTLRYQHHIPLMFHVAEAYEIRSSFERSYVAFFLYEQVALQESVEYRREVIEHYFQLYEAESVTAAFKTNALRLIVNPTIRMYYSSPNDDSLITQELVNRVAVLMWRPLANAPQSKQHQLDDTLLIEIFILTTLLITHCKDKVSDPRKDAFRLAWMGLNLLEPTVKLTAYILVAKFMYTFDTPVKFVRLTWIGLLRLKDTENRALYRQAVDIMADALPFRDPPSPPTVPEWATRVRAVLVEDGHNVSQLITVCDLLVTHSDLFYDYRELYVPFVANSLSKLAFVQAAAPETKQLTVDVVEMIYKWEKRRMAAKEEAMEIDRSEPSPAKRQRIDRAGTAISASSSGSWAAPSLVKELITTHLLRVVSSSTDLVSRGGLTKRTLELFREIMGPNGLPNVSVKLAYFNRTMTSEITGDNITYVANSAEVVAVIAANRDDQWVRVNLATLTKLLEKVWLFDDTAFHAVVRPLTERMFNEMPEDPEQGEPDAVALYNFVRNTVTENLAASSRSSANLPGTLFLLKCWLKVQPNVLQNETVSQSLLRVLGNLVKLHTTYTGNGPDPAYRLIISILDVVRDRVADFREHRRHLYGVLVSLVDRSTNITLCRYLLDLLRQWVVKDVEGPTLGKEKAAVLLHMMAFEMLDEKLFQQYLDLIYDIYENTSLRSSDITHRLEPAFLLGTRSKNPTQRMKFMEKLEQSIPRSLDARLQYLCSLQNWETLADSYWIPQILYLILGVANQHQSFIRPLARLMETDIILDMAKDASIGDFVRSARNLIFLDSGLCHQLWVAIFPICWQSLSRAQQLSFTPYIIKLLAKDYHKKQIDLRPNVIQTFLEGVLACYPRVTLPPMLVKYLAKTYNCWYTGFEILNALSEVFRGDDSLRESCTKALSELYADLSEDDMFYGLARSHCVFPETTAGLTYEQNGQWPKAIEMYEQAQMKARGSLMPFSEDEYCLWEDHWILAAQKLQHWDTLTELARMDQDSDLLLECAWRLSDWGSADREMIETNINRVSDVPTPRRKVFEAFTALIKAHSNREPPNDFLRILDEAQQVAIRKWTTLPNHITGAHLPLLQMFQQCVELSEASTIFESLQMTNASNLEARITADLKQSLQTWRDRLPNFWDDISVWSDLLAWRQHIFTAITKVYVPLIPPTETGTYGYRGYHETAWMINRFGEVARRHGLLDVCSTALNKIYSLPNIEISEAFLKLREQALCFFQKPDKFNDGLDNISTTNLMYFAPSQKAEFLMLKGMFIARLGQNEEANAEFAHALQMDMNLPKAWAEWGKFNDKLYQERPEYVPGGAPEPEPGQPKLTDAQWKQKYDQDRALLASSAVSCYMSAAGLYNNHKSRALFLRVLWLLGLDDSQNTIAKAFEGYKGDLVIWYWITLIPQLLLSLSHREAKQARLLLLRIAKLYPQALFYQLRVVREDFGSIKRQHLTRAAKKNAEAAKSGLSVEVASSPAVENKDVKEEGVPPGSTAPATPASSTMPPPSAAAPQGPEAPRHPWELVDDVISLLKTAYPFLTLSMEKMVDQISHRAKPSSDEDIYRFFAALLNDAMQQRNGRSGLQNDDADLPPVTKETLNKFASNLSGDLKLAIENDFMKETPKMKEYIKRLQTWRDHYEQSIDARQRTQSLDQNGCNLIDFHHNKFDDVEIPGQYMQHIDATEELVKIARYHPKIELARGHGHCYRRITMVGSNGTSVTFAVQLPAARHCRREERLMQLFRIMNSVLKNRKESRRRNLQIHIPTALNLSPVLRLLQNDASYVSMQDIYDEFSTSKGMSREDTILAFYDRVKQIHDPAIPRSDQRFIQLKAEIIEELQTKMVPENVLTNYMIRTMTTPENLWLMRKQFALQTATASFLSYTCCLTNRTPSRYHLSRKTGLMFMTEILPSFSHNQAQIASTDAVPFRLTPNMQHFITRAGIEGVVSAATTAISRSLSQPEFDLSGTLSLFIRDEILSWQNQVFKEPRPEFPLTSIVSKNVETFIRRVSMIGYISDNKDKAPNAPPIVHGIVTLISQATSPILLAQMSEMFMAWF